MDTSTHRVQTEATIANWLRAHAEGLLVEGDNYAKRFTGHYDPREVK